MEAARRDFVANVSHELKTPVAAMGLLAEATVDAADDPVAVRRFAGKLQAEAVRLGALVNELIALSRLQGADPLPDLAVVEVDAVIAGDRLAGCNGSRERRHLGDLRCADRAAGTRGSFAAGHRIDQSG